MAADPTLVEEMARDLIRARGAASVVTDEQWPHVLHHHREMCAKYPDYASAHSLTCDAFRDAQFAFDWFAKLLTRPDVVERAAKALLIANQPPLGTPVADWGIQPSNVRARYGKIARAALSSILGDTDAQ